MEHKLPFGLKDGKLVEVSQVLKGLDCNCICPSCKSSLVARKGAKKVHHFAHYKKSDCVGGVETALHLAAKEILEKNREIKIPAVTSSNVNTKRILYDEQTIHFEKVFLENRINDIIPDLIIEFQGKQLLIEIAVTHFIDVAKLQKIKQLNISALEINLSKINKQITFDALKKILIEEVTNKKWIYNTKKELFQKNIKSFGKVLEGTYRGFARHIDYCPIRARIWKGKPYANFIDDCCYCDYLIDIIDEINIRCGASTKDKFDKFISKYKK